jgi:hypothetical protein
MIEIIVERSYYTGEEVNGKGVLRAQLIADTAAELAGVTEVGGNKLDFGSIAHAVNDAQILRLNSSGDWIIQTGDDAGKTPAEVASSKALSAPKTALTKTADNAEFSEEIEGDGTGEPLPEVEKTAYPDDAEPLEPVEKSVETVDGETKKAVNIDGESE